MIKYYKYLFFLISLFLVTNALMSQSVEPHFNPDDDSTHVIKIRKSDGTIEYFKHGALIHYIRGKILIWRKILKMMTH